MRSKRAVLRSRQATTTRRYAAFYAVSALPALEGMTFRKHSGVEGAVHQALVLSGQWPPDLGTDYRALRTLRNTGDYGGLEHVTAVQSQEAVKAAERILEAVARACPSLTEGGDVDVT